MPLSLLVRLPNLVLQGCVYIVGGGEAYGRFGIGYLAGDVVFGGAQGTERPFRRKINPSSVQRPGHTLAQTRDELQ